MFCKNCGNALEAGSKFCAKCGENTGPLELQYYGVSTKRLVFMSLLTLGLYHFYWFYQNWKIVRNTERTYIMPFWRSVFLIFFCYPLFKRITDQADRHGYKSHSPVILALLYISILLFSGEVDYSVGVVLLDVLIEIILFLISILPLALIQQAVNFNNSKINPVFTTARKLSYGEIVLIVMGVLMTGGFVLLRLQSAGVNIF